MMHLTTPKLDPASKAADALLLFCRAGQPRIRATTTLAVSTTPKTEDRARLVAAFLPKEGAATPITMIGAHTEPRFWPQVASQSEHNTSAQVRACTMSAMCQPDLLNCTKGRTAT